MSSNLTNSLLLVVSSCTFYHNAMVFWQPAKQYSVLKVKLTISQSIFFYNNGIGVAPINMRFDCLLVIAIKQCKVFSNLLSFEFNRVTRVVISGYNIFQNNTAKRFLSVSNSYPIFKVYNEFSNNTSNSILTLYQYVTMEEGTVMNITNNKVFSNVHTVSKQNQQHWALLHFGTRHALFPCPFQFTTTSQAFENYRQLINVNISIMNNSNYYCAIYGTQLNSCYWHDEAVFKSIGTKNNYSVTPGEVYRKVFYADENQQILTRQGAILCTCTKNTEIDCFNDHIAPAYPGETITINVILLPPHPETAVYIDSSQVLNNSIPLPCEVPLSRVYLVSNKCTFLAYKVVTKYPKACSVYLKTSNQPETLFIYHLHLKDCPLGFQHINGLCACNPLLVGAFPDIQCDINTQMITRPMNSWIGTTGTKSDILYIQYCIAYFCLAKPSNIHLQYPDSQCVNNRMGVMCGHCPPGYDSVFGSLKCKQCSSIWLLLLPVFLLAGVLVVGMRRLCRHNFEHNGYVWESGIMLAF
ncbi:uncharacterized protein [Dysidea avara]|uniref:uncharacterized protein n=1 Tax=Dysidea avara TaxID=196820 RepID=UPI00331721F9